MPDILAVHAAAHPDRPALIQGDRVLSFALFNERATRAANAFGELGLEPGQRAAVQSLNSTAGFEVSAGLRKVEGVGVPVNFRLRGEELAYVLTDSGARLICAGPDFVEHVEAVRPRIAGDPTFIALGSSPPPAGWLAYEDLLARASPEAPPPSAAEGLGSSMIYTSGTTGHPKGAYRPEGVPLDYVLQSLQLFGLGADDVHLMAGPGYHSAVGYFCALTGATGGTVVIMPRFDAEEALRLIQRHRVTTTFMAPTLLHRIMDLPEEVRARYDVSSMRSLILGAAPCPVALKERAVRYFGECLYEFYGATETGINLVLRPQDQLRKPGSAGTVAPGQEILLLDDDGNPVPEGQPGELWVRNDFLAT
jgi:acyl-CoA synthetase (AMP-forming)/AMP-acid ligase II